MIIYLTSTSDISLLLPSIPATRGNRCAIKLVLAGPVTGGGLPVFMAQAISQ